MNLNQVTLPAMDLDESILFYKKLGLKLIVFSEDHYARFECPTGDSTFSLHKHLGQVNTYNYTYFEVINIKEVVNKLIKDENLHFDELPAMKPWLWEEARLKDPSGNLIIIYEAGENRKNPPWRLKS